MAASAAVVALLFDYAFVGLVVGLLLFDRWIHLPRGIVLDTFFVVILLYTVALWFLSGWMRRWVFSQANRRDANRTPK